MRLLPLPGLAACLLASCAPSTPDARIQANPALFNSLPASEQALVQQGKIDIGMPPQAVYLAWGKASLEYSGSDDSGNTLRWDYAGSQPVYINNYYGGYGYGRIGPYGRVYPGYAYGVAPQVEYVPYRRATVWFTNDRVTKWERSR
jgi:hypothetical protein